MRLGVEAPGEGDLGDRHPGTPQEMLGLRHALPEHELVGAAALGRTELASDVVGAQRDQASELRQRQALAAVPTMPRSVRLKPAQPGLVTLPSGLAAILLGTTRCGDRQSCQATTRELVRP